MTIGDGLSLILTLTGSGMLVGLFVAVVLKAID